MELVGGHNMAAKAIQEELILQGQKADMIEYLEIINPKLKDGVNNLYLKSTKKEGKIFKNIYKLGELYEKTKLKSPVYWVNSLSKKKLYKYIKDNEYNYVVTTHLFAAQALTAVKKKENIHFLQIATDYVSIPFWSETNPDYFVVPSEELENDFIEKGIPKDKLVPLGIPVCKEYREKLDKDKCKEELNLDVNQKYVLILNGSMGFGNVTEIVKKLLAETNDINYIVSSGNNKELLKELNNIQEEDDRLIVLPFKKDLSKFMRSS